MGVIGSREGENEREQRERTDRFFKPPPSFCSFRYALSLLPSPSSLRYPCLSCARRRRVCFVLSSVSSVSGARRSSVAVDIRAGGVRVCGGSFGLRELGLVPPDSSQRANRIECARRGACVGGVWSTITRFMVGPRIQGNEAYVEKHLAL